jgi:type VI secretion system secreted protein Hcp
MAVDMFLKLSGIDGESRDDKHKNEIEILSYSWGATNSGTMQQGGGGGRGKVSVHDFSITKKVDKATPKLFLACATGEHIPEAKLTVRKAGGEQQEFLTVKMSDLLVSSYQTGGASSDPVPTDQVSFNFAKIEIEYRQQRDEGTVGGTESACWDVRRNQRC